MRPTTFDCNKPDHFIDFYRKTLKEPRRLLEIGVQTGRSLRMWANAFPNAEIVGVDINRPTEELPETNITFIKGDHTDVSFLETLGDFDIVIDDGDHITSHQQLAFETLWPHINSGGMYIIEDLETSYKEEFIDGKKTTDYAKELVERVQNGDIKSLTFIKDLVAIEKV